MLKRFFPAGGALILAAATCTAQQNPPHAATPPATPAATAAPTEATVPALERKIEIMIRSELGVPPQYEVAIGPRQKSDVNGYDTIAVTFSLPSQPQKKQRVDFLLSKDSNTLARLSKWDIGPDPATTLPTEGRPVRGNPSAKVTIVNFDDLECPYCAQMNAEFFPATLDRYKGLVKFVYLDYPLVEIHPWAMHAAVDANCLSAQDADAYWNYVDYLHTHGQDVSGPDKDPTKSAAALDKLADQEGTREHLDAARLDACLAKQDDSKVIAEMKAGDKAGVNATPTFFVSGERWAGQLEQHQLWIMIDRALAEQGIAPPVTAQPSTSVPPAPGR
ncbi:MAG TPA: thioredoxin domain-containing protein [Acidobacteriaceae bacterium]|nr:thioredoxin domain-containing protein [Acidobacteriaceae bacterium]